MPTRIFITFCGGHDKHLLAVRVDFFFYCILLKIYEKFRVRGYLQGTDVELAGAQARL